MTKLHTHVAHMAKHMNMVGVPGPGLLGVPLIRRCLTLKCIADQSSHCCDWFLASNLPPPQPRFD